VASVPPDADDDVTPLLLPLLVLVDEPVDVPELGVPELDVPDVAWVPVLLVALLLVALLLVPVLLVCVEAGNTAATAPAATTLATPTPTVVADSRRMPRRRSRPGGIGRSAGLTGIGYSFPCWRARAGGQTSSL